MGDRAGTAWRQLQLHSARVGGRFTVARSLRSIGEIARLRRVFDNEADYVTLLDMLAELREDNLQPRRACAKHADCATATAMLRPRGGLRPSCRISVYGDFIGALADRPPGANVANELWVRLHSGDPGTGGNRIALLLS